MLFSWVRDVEITDMLMSGSLELNDAYLSPRDRDRLTVSQSMDHKKLHLSRGMTQLGVSLPA
jgi:hypothetical protein